MSDQPLCPPTIVYGSETPDLRMSMKGGVQRVFCNNNRTLHLSSESLNDEGTYEMGALLGSLCRELCRPARTFPHQPCPAFVSSWKVGKKDYPGLATVEMRPVPEWEACAGVHALLEANDTLEERFLLRSYLGDRFGHERVWRDELVSDWNSHWHRVENRWGEWSRSAVFDAMLWATIRCPALIPQAWLNYLFAASEDEQKILDRYPSRVDFIAFHGGRRHVVEVDGPSHYASYDERFHDYHVDERAYARNLKIARSLAGDEWILTRIARVEVHDVIESDFPEIEGIGLVSLLPGSRDEYPQTSLPLSLREALMEVEHAAAAAVAPADDDIPF